MNRLDYFPHLDYYCIMPFMKDTLRGLAPCDRKFVTQKEHEARESKSGVIDIQSPFINICSPNKALREAI